MLLLYTRTQESWMRKQLNRDFLRLKRIGLRKSKTQIKICKFNMFEKHVKIRKVKPEKYIYIYIYESRRQTELALINKKKKKRKRKKKRLEEKRERELQLWIFPLLE